MTKQQPSRPLCVAALLLGIASAAHGQASLTADNGQWVYSEDFSSLSTATGTTQTFNLQGWSLYSHGSGSERTTYVPQWQTGISDGNTFYHARNTTEDAPQRGFLGARTGASMGDATIALRLTNDSGITLTSFDLSFLATQFFSTNQPQNLLVSFSTNATSVTSGAWTQLGDLTYSAPYTEGNRTVTGAEELAARSLQTLAGQSLVWENGQDLWIRWDSIRGAGASAVLAIDDVQFSAIPEPSTYALIFGIGAVGVAILRRRIRR
jgi:hypothetical protein